MNLGAKGAKAEAVPTIGEQDFEREVLRTELPVLLEFSAEPCLMRNQRHPGNFLHPRFVTER